MLFKANSFLKTWCLCTEHCGLLDLLGLGRVRLAAGLAVVPAKAVLVRHVDGAHGHLSREYHARDRERRGELGLSAGNKTSVVLQVVQPEME